MASVQDYCVSDHSAMQRYRSFCILNVFTELNYIYDFYINAELTPTYSTGFTKRSAQNYVHKGSIRGDLVYGLLCWNIGCSCRIDTILAHGTYEELLGVTHSHMFYNMSPHYTWWGENCWKDGTTSLAHVPMNISAFESPGPFNDDKLGAVHGLRNRKGILWCLLCNMNPNYVMRPKLLTRCHAFQTQYLPT